MNHFEIFTFDVDKCLVKLIQPFWTVRLKYLKVVTATYILWPKEELRLIQTSQSLLQIVQWTTSEVEARGNEL